MFLLLDIVSNQPTNINKFRNKRCNYIHCAIIDIMKEAVPIAELPHFAIAIVSSL
jgi:hypothetical protein